LRIFELAFVFFLLNTQMSYQKQNNNVNDQIAVQTYYTVQLVQMCLKAKLMCISPSVCTNLITNKKVPKQNTIRTGSFRVQQVYHSEMEKNQESS
jgi:hypothetical protein